MLFLLSLELVLLTATSDDSFLEELIIEKLEVEIIILELFALGKLRLETFIFNREGLFVKESQSVNISPISSALSKFHFVISGKDISILHSENIDSILVTLEVFHFEISGKVFND